MQYSKCQNSNPKLELQKRHNQVKQINLLITGYQHSLRNYYYPLKEPKYNGNEKHQSSLSKKNMNYGQNKKPSKDGYISTKSRHKKVVTNF